MAYCEDYPACGHTPLDPCDVQWYDAPDAFDTSVHPHALCDHENGDCDVEYDYDEDEEDDDYDYANEGREDIHLDGMWEE